LKRSNGNPTTYRKLLALFHQGWHDFLEQFTLAQQSGDKAAAIRLAHTLKSVSGTVGAQQVFEAAKELEDVCQNLQDSQSPQGPQNPALIAPYLDNVVQQLQCVMAGLADLILQLPVSPTVATEPIEMNLGQLQTDLVHIKELLIAGNTEALDAIEGLCVQCGLQNSHWKILEKKAKVFDFQGASEALDDWVLALKTTPTHHP
jgi:HPt (histidine-containing phosphotransfer) domain-containing protein